MESIGPLTNPPDKIYAFVQNILPPLHKGQQRAIFGVAVHIRSGKVLETAILPTKQRVMLALGVSNDKAHAHHKYRQYTKGNYKLIWTDNPMEEPDLIDMRDRLQAVNKGVKQAIREERTHAQENRPAETPAPTTEALVKAGADKAADETRQEIEKAKTDTKGFFS